MIPEFVIKNKTRDSEVVLREDILQRYHNAEYWDFSYGPVRDILKGLSPEEVDAVVIGLTKEA